MYVIIRVIRFFTDRERNDLIKYSISEYKNEWILYSALHKSKVYTEYINNNSL